MENNTENIQDQETIVSEEEIAAQERAEKIKAARKDMIAGALWCVGGLLFTYLSYYFAKSGATYTVATGAILWGGIEGIKGLVAYLIQLKKDGDSLKFRKSLCYGIVGIAAVVGLAVYGWRFVHKDDLKPLAKEQTVNCPVGLTFTFPSGCEAVEEDFVDETDSTFAYYYYSTSSADIVYNVNVIEGLADTTGNGNYLYSEQYYHDSSVDYYGEGNILKEGWLDLNGIQAYKTSGISSVDDFVENTYELVFNSLHITVACLYPGKELNPDAEAAADGFVRSIIFDKVI